MKTYHFYLVNDHGQVSAAESRAAPDDESARTTARQLLSASPGAQRVEVWDIGRRLKVVRRTHGLS